MPSTSARVTLNFVAVFEPIFRALHDSKARFVVVGGLAVVMHGHSRLTSDVDIIIDFETMALRSAMESFVKIGLRARAPVDPLAFADDQQRKSRMEEKNMQVFSFWDPQQPLRTVDIFVDHPIPFEQMWQRAKIVQLEDMTIRIAAIDDLIALKEGTGREVDRCDIEALRKLETYDGHELLSEE